MEDEGDGSLDEEDEFENGKLSAFKVMVTIDSFENRIKNAL